MAEPPQEGTPAPQTPDYAKAIEELKAANVALVQKLGELEAKSKGYDEKITALSGAAKQAAAEQIKAAAEQGKSGVDIAFNKAMRDLGLYTDKE